MTLHVQAQSKYNELPAGATIRFLLTKVSYNITLKYTIFYKLIINFKITVYIQYIYLIIIYCTFFPFSHLSYVEVLRCLAAAPSRISWIQSCTDYYIFPPSPSHQSYWLAQRCWELFTNHTLPCINSIFVQPAFFLDSCPLKMRPISCPKRSLKINSTCCLVTQKSIDLNFINCCCN